MGNRVWIVELEARFEQSQIPYPYYSLLPIIYYLFLKFQTGELVDCQEIIDGHSQKIPVKIGRAHV